MSDMTRVSVNLDDAMTRVRVVESAGEPRGVLEVVAGNLLLTLTTSAGGLVTLTRRIADAMNVAVNDLERAVVKREGAK